jgi:pimeloyl-ACP methyl ester carboxylesterase
MNIKTVVFIHGAGGGGWEWDFWTPAFKNAGWHCVAEALQPTKDGLEQTRFADYLTQTERWAANEHPVFIGASMGGILALKASEATDPAALVLVNSVPPVGARRASLSELRGTPRLYPTIVEWSKSALQETIDAMPDGDEATIRFAHARWRDESGAVLNEISQGIAVNLPKCPVLVVIGEEDADISPETGRAIAGLYNADVLAYEGMSHVGPLLGNRATEVAKSVLDWLLANIR